MKISLSMCWGATLSASDSSSTAHIPPALGDVRLMELGGTAVSWTYFDVFDCLARTARWFRGRAASSSGYLYQYSHPVGTRGTLQATRSVTFRTIQPIGAQLPFFAALPVLLDLRRTLRTAGLEPRRTHWHPHMVCHIQEREFSIDEREWGIGTIAGARLRTVRGEALHGPLRRRFAREELELYATRMHPALVPRMSRWVESLLDRGWVPASPHKTAACEPGDPAA